MSEQYSDIVLDHAENPRNQGTLEDANARGYMTNVEMRFHTDACDYVGLLCLQTPMSGGASRIASSVTVYNTMLRLMPPGAKATTSLYATHPGTRDRIKRLQLAIAKDKSPIAANVGHAGWAGLKSSFPTRSRFRLA